MKLSWFQIFRYRIKDQIFECMMKNYEVECIGFVLNGKCFSWMILYSYTVFFFSGFKYYDCVTIFYSNNNKWIEINSIVFVLFRLVSGNSASHSWNSFQIKPVHCMCEKCTVRQCSDACSEYSRNSCQLLPRICLVVRLSVTLIFKAAHL
jgi:hypothetical protein